MKGTESYNVVTLKVFRRILKDSCAVHLNISVPVFGGGIQRMVSAGNFLFLTVDDEDVLVKFSIETGVGIVIHEIF